MTPRVLFVGRTRYRLPLPDSLARKWDALSDRMQVRVVASGTGSDPRFHLVPPRALDGPLFYSTLPVVVAQELRSFRPDVVVAESPYEAAAAEVARAATRSKAKVVVEVHGDWRVWSSHYGSRFRALLRPASDAVAGWAVDHADGHRAVSGFTASLLESRGRHPLGVFTTYSDLGAFTGPRVPVPGEPRVLFVGVLERYKNVEGLAAAWRVVARRVPGAQLHLIGKGTLTEVAEGLARDGVSWEREAVASEDRGGVRRSPGPAPPVCVGRPSADRDRVVPPRSGGRRDARRRDSRPRRGRGQRVAGRARRHRRRSQPRSSGS